MEQKNNKGELLIAGVGGWGIVTIGNILADAAIQTYENVAWFPSYATMMRGGETECCITFSQERIASPIIYKSSAVMVLGASRIDAFKNRVKPGGVMIIEKTGITKENKVSIEDADVRYVSAIDAAQKLGNIKNANLVIMGAYIGITGLMSKESVLERIGVRFGGGAGKEGRVSAAKDAFIAGIGLV